MRTINLIMHYQSLHHLFDQTDYFYQLYGRHESNAENKITKLKEEEDLFILLDCILKHTDQDEQMSICDGYYWNYTIPRIGKEFDLIRIGTNSVINIEIKSIATKDKMKAQLYKNLKYLKILGRPVHLFSFSSSKKTLYKLVGDEFEKATFDELIQLLRNQTVDQSIEINSIFSPIQFLISPFNNTEKFLNDEYFLTTQQEQIFNEITEFKTSYHEILGRVGTGKSLLLYHIAKQLMNHECYTNHVAILHCGNLNAGHRILIQSGYRIYSMHHWQEILNDEDIFILCIDEFQRIHFDQFETIMEFAQRNNIKVILSVDPIQVFDMRIKEEAPYQKCKSKYGFIEYSLSDHIRSNPDISRFAKDVMNLNEHHGRIPSNNIHIHGTNSYSHAREMIDIYTSKGYRFINYLSQHFQNSLLDDDQDNILEIIGQEYDKVITILDDAFYYNQNRMLDAHTREDIIYLRPEMFYEAITRARVEIIVIVIQNPELFTTILKLF